MSAANGRLGDGAPEPLRIVFSFPRGRDTSRAEVLGSIALVLGVVFVSTTGVRLTRPDVDLLLVLLHMALGIL